jgi:beta-barrel assembly-enhancing protease
MISAGVQKRCVISALVLCLWGLLSCSSIPRLETSHLDSLAEDEKRIWMRSCEEESRLNKSGQLDESDDLNQYINEVAMRLLPSGLRAQNFPLKVKVIRNPFLNAFAFAHGVIYIHSGFLAKIENEAQLAVLLGHELAHILHRHPVQHFRQVQNINASFALLSIASARAGVYANLVGLLGVLGASASISGYSRVMESEADKTGLELMVAAGYDPNESIVLFDHLERQMKDREDREPFFFGSHPRLVDRRSNYADLLRSNYSGVVGFKGVTEYAEKTSRIILETAAWDVAQGRWEWAKETIERFISKYPANAEGYFHLGELYRLRNEGRDLDRAEEAFDRTLQLDANFALAYRGLGLVHLKKGDSVRAAVDLKRFLVLQPQAKDREFIESYTTTRRSTP